MHLRLYLTEQQSAAVGADQDFIGFTHQGTPTHGVEFEVIRVTLCH